MSSGCDHRNIHNRRRHNQISIFLPMFCRLSFQDIINPHSRHKNPISGDGEPSSPKVSCMGQVKRNNRVIGFPAAAPLSGAAQHHRNSRLKNLFSGKTLLPPPIPSGGSVAAAGGFLIGSKRCSSSRCPKGSRRLNLKNNDDCAGAVNVCELDPPLPVVRRMAPAGDCGGEANLWRRRFNGAAALQIEQIPNLPSGIIISQPPTV